jgi:ribosomal protein S18 acetylase RimI-like enzyme
MQPAENLSNILWRSLSGSHVHLSQGTESIRRYARGYSPLIGFADPSTPDLDAIAPFCESGERFYCAEWKGEAPSGWTVHMDTFMCAMLWSGGAAPKLEPGLNAVRLSREHVTEMTALAALTKPGPFAERTIELGDFYGVIEDGRLVAMAGERMQAGNLREISGVCTLPDQQGRGLARALTKVVINAQLSRGQQPFLHVASSNTRAKALYERLGFHVDREIPLRVISK